MSKFGKYFLLATGFASSFASDANDLLDRARSQKSGPSDARHSNHAGAWDV